MSNRNLHLTLAAALAGAVSLATIAPAAAQEVSMIKCYGIAKAGENSCANAAGTHSCAGQSTVDYDGGEWRAVPAAAVCENLDGKLEAFEGVNPAKAM